MVNKQPNAVVLTILVKYKFLACLRIVQTVVYGYGAATLRNAVESACQLIVVVVIILVCLCGKLIATVRIE